MAQYDFVPRNLEIFFKDYKVDILREKAIEENAVMIALVETHLRKEIVDAEMKINGYQLFRADRKEGVMKGGVH